MSETPRAAAARTAAGAADELWAYLRAHHCGEARAIRQAELARRLGMSSRVLQVALLYLLEERNQIVCSSCRPPFGVYVPETAFEKERYALQLEHRIIALAARLRRLRKTPRLRIWIQGGLADPPRRGAFRDSIRRRGQ